MSDSLTCIDKSSSDLTSPRSNGSSKPSVPPLVLPISRAALAPFRAPTRTRAFHLEPIPWAAGRALTTTPSNAFLSHGRSTVRGSFVIFSRTPLPPKPPKRKRPIKPRVRKSKPNVSLPVKNQTESDHSDSESLQSDDQEVSSGDSGLEQDQPDEDVLRILDDNGDAEQSSSSVDFS